MAAYTAAGAAARAAAATLASLEKVTAMYTSTRQYYMLDDLAETSTQAKRGARAAAPPSTLSLGTEPWALT